MRGIVINTERLTLKSPVKIVNSSEVLMAINNTETLKYLSSAPKKYTLENAQSFLDFLSKTEDSEKRLELGAFEKLSGQFIGMITLENIDCNSFSCDLGYWISKPNTGKGLAFEGSTQLIQFAYDKLKIKRIDAFVIKEHIKSIALLERLGFEKMELLLENEENDGVLVDRYKYSFIKSNQTE